MTRQQIEAEIARLQAVLQRMPVALTIESASAGARLRFEMWGGGVTVTRNIVGGEGFQYAGTYHPKQAAELRDFLNLNFPKETTC